MQLPSDSPDLDRLRRRVSLSLLGGVSIGSTAFIISMTVTALVAESITGDPTWSGIPVASSILGTAVGTSVLSMAMSRWGRRSSLMTFYAVAAAGGAIACTATSIASLPLLVLGVFVVGLGNSANALTRYVAADLQAPARRATMVGWIVWAGTIGAVIGPNLLSPSDQAGLTVGLPPLAGTYLASTITFLGAVALYMVVLRPEPSLLSFSDEPEDVVSSGLEVSGTRLLRVPRVQVSIAALVFGHAVMVLVMTMTPLHVRAAGHGLEIVGLIASSHIVGMFGLAPFTGWLVDRVGAFPVILGGQVTLLVSALGGMLVPPSRPVWIAATLFLLGLGWNLGFVAGSANLTLGVARADRARLQGRADSMIWVAAAAASLLSSLLFSAVGFAGLSAVGMGVVLVSLATIVARRRHSVERPADRAA